LPTLGTCSLTLPHFFFQFSPEKASSKREAFEVEARSLGPREARRTQMLTARNTEAVSRSDPVEAGLDKDRIRYSIVVVVGGESK
jgi:hypothetical protein